MIQEHKTQERLGAVGEREEKEILQALRKSTSTFYTFRGIDERIVRFRSQSTYQEAFKVAFRRVG